MAIVIGALLVPVLLVVLLFGGGLIFYSKKIGEATADGGSRIDDNKPQAGSIDVWYNIAERPDYQKTVDYSHKLAKETETDRRERRKGFLKDNNLSYNTPQQGNTSKPMCKCSRHTTSTKPKDSEFNSVNTKELDDMITYRKTQVDQIVEQFNKT